MNRKYDVCAIGNALVDYEIEVDEHFFLENGVEKGMMTLVDADRQSVLLGKAHGKVKNRQGGGSAANSIFGLRLFGGKGYYTCKVGNDEDGKLYLDDLKAAGIDSNLDEKHLYNGSTGKCLVMITPDSERTMNTFLGITTDFSSEELDREVIKDSNYLFMEGFLVSSETGLVAMKEAKKVAQENGTKVSLTFSDPSMVKYFKSQMIDVVGDGVDLLFCNIQEAELFTGESDFEKVKNGIMKIAKQFVITFSEKGSVVFDGQNLIHIKPFPVKSVDSTGAGDMFAGAFLYGINHGYSHERAGLLASAASSEVVGKYGPRLNESHIEKIFNKIELKN